MFFFVLPLFARDGFYIKGYKTDKYYGKHLGVIELGFTKLEKAIEFMIVDTEDSKFKNIVMKKNPEKALTAYNNGSAYELTKKDPNNETQKFEIIPFKEQDNLYKIKHKGKCLKRYGIGDTMDRADCLDGVDRQLFEFIDTAVGPDGFGENSDVSKTGLNGSDSKLPTKGKRDIGGLGSAKLDLTMNINDEINSRSKSENIVSNDMDGLSDMRSSCKALLGRV